MVVSAWNCTKPPEADQARVTEQVEKIPESIKGDAYPINLEKSKIHWIGTKVTGRHHGVVDLKSGKLIVDNGHVAGGNFTADMTTIIVQDLEGKWKDKLEGHLKKDDFFQTDQYPEATFEIAGLSENGDMVDIKGNLVIRGITKTITFPAKLEMADGKPVSAKANFNINRRLWGINYNGKVNDAISDMINLDLDLKF